MLELLSMEQLERSYRDYRRQLMEARAIHGTQPGDHVRASEKVLSQAIIARDGHSKLDAIRRDVDSDVFDKKRKANGDDGVIVEILTIASPTSLNISKMPDGKYRATALARGGKEWFTGFGVSPGAALRQLADKAKA